MPFSLQIIPGEMNTEENLSIINITNLKFFSNNSQNIIGFDISVDKANYISAWLDPDILRFEITKPWFYPITYNHTYLVLKG